jgi:S-formylglutathione hydrolase FrmB
VGKDVEKYDLHALARKPLKTGPKVALRFDCGVDDFLIQDNRAFHAHLDKIGYKHEYHEFPGAHTWDYWDLHVRESIAFALEHMKTK